MDNYEPKYRNIIEIENGIYKPEDILFLIEKGIYIRSLEYDYLLKFSTGDTNVFAREIIYNNEVYRLSDDALNDIYTHLQFLSESLFNDLSFNERELIFNLKKHLSKDEKIKFLKEKHTEYFEKIDDFDGYLLYADNIDINGFNSWRELVLEVYFDDNLINTFLTTQDSITPQFFKEDDFFQLWILFYEVWKMTNFIKDKIQELENNQSESISYENRTNSKGNDFAKNIFRTFESEQKFRFLVSKIDSDKNPAFFSYLYFYFKDELKELVVLGDTNKSYIDFIKLNKWIYKDKFTRIIKASTENSQTRRNMYSAFENKLKSYSVDE